MAKKDLIKTENGSDSKEQTDNSLRDEVIEFITGQEEHPREDKVLMLVLLGLKPTKAARMSGYSESYSRFGIHRALRESKMFGEKLDEILGKMPAVYRQYCAARLFRVAGIEDKALQEMEIDPTLAIRHPQILRQLKVACGAMVEEHTPQILVPVQVAVQVQNFLSEQQGQHSHTQKVDAIDAEEGESTNESFVDVR